MKIAIIGATGMVGHVLFSELKNKNIEVIGIGRRKTDENILIYDLYNEFDKLKLFLKDGNFNIVINCSAILVNESNINKLNAVYINALLPHLLVDIFKNTETKIIHLSTGGVFSGNDDFYFEDSQISPQTYYGITKAAGEFNNDKDLVIRSDFWGPDIKKDGTGLFNWFLNQNGEISAYTNVFFNGISNVELSGIILDLINITGILHIGSLEKYSKSVFLNNIKTNYNFNNITLINNDKIKKNIFLKSKNMILPINDIDTMIKNTYQYLIKNNNFYTDIYPRIYNIH